MKGIIVINGYYRSENEKRRCQKLTDAFLKRQVNVTVVPNNAPFSETDFSDVDFCVFFDKDSHLSRFLENIGVRVFNSTEVLEITDNKINTYLFLKKKGVEMPATVPSPKKFFYAPDRAYLDAVAEKLGLPLVLKEACGSLGKQVYLIKNKEELYRMDEETGTKDKLFQAYYHSSIGESVRVICIGGKAVGAMKLVSEGDFRSNAHLGGKGEVFPLTEEYKTVAETVANALCADYLGIDFFADRPVLIEVNGNAYFSQFEEVTGIDVAEMYADYILDSLR